MGIFDKLFGKKKEQPQQQTLPPDLQKKMNETDELIKKALDAAVHPTAYDYKKAQAEIRAKSLRASSRIPGAEKLVLAERQEESHAETINITQFFPVDKKRFVVFDLETTGLNYVDNKIIEIGAVRVENGEITEEYSQLVNPECRIPADASAVNGITDDMVIGQPTIQEVLPSFLMFVGDDILAAHNVKFDYQFLANACMMYFYRTPGEIFDTMLLARYYPESASKKLTSLVNAAGIEIESAHRALSDARMAAKLILATNERRKKK